MKRKVAESIVPYNLQTFASTKDGKEGGNVGSEEPDIDDNEPDDDDDDDDDDEPASGTKTFTQEQVTAMMAKEKKEGRKAMLKKLGFANEAEASKAMKIYQAMMNSQKTEEELEAEKNKGLEGEKSEAEKRAQAAEDKLSCVMAGVRKDSIDDALAVAKLKVTDEKTLDKVLADMKKEPRYAGFFKEDGNDGDDDEEGTGSEPGHTTKKGKPKKGSYGANLAKGLNKGEQKKTYF
nr:MAG TPA: Major capsid protein [Bacteriophage sp.]